MMFEFRFYMMIFLAYILKLHKNKCKKSLLFVIYV